MSKSVLVPLATGFEEIEAISIIDTLRRAGANVTIASINQDLIVTSAHHVKIIADSLLKDVSTDSFDMIALPGGYDGAMSLAKEELPQQVIKEFHQKGKFVSAICAAPIALHSAGVLKGIEFTCYPGMEGLMPGGIYIDDQNVVVSGKVITSRGPATALAFGLTLVEQLFSLDKAKELAAGMLKSCC
ncbi:hypothetical protein CCZ01_08730 [Helicobacter monodelphidis]|uniref:DJ-1 family glyoxalase III n=1 Tax=Helicobacter sp. 15-1451 TaxID=2004995 RepID=UPI000DCCD38C|nr:DJ-1 family glyoxalase III [Helicobacter sp. 15-1451]RAX56721.1 hypothetical protein CCZ01_08730 [Helicobacter sp. 15-1451]